MEKLFNLYTNMEHSIWVSAGLVSVGESFADRPRVTHKAVRPGARPHVPPVMTESGFRLMTPLYDNLQ